jgi:hypothetical protein
MIEAVATINNKEYNLPMSYKDISLGKFKAIQDFLYSDLYKDKTEQIVKGEIKDEEEILNFMFDYINYVTDIPLKELKQVRRFSKDEETGIEELFYAMTFLFTVPIIDDPKPAERLGEYYFIDKIDLTQAILKDLQFIEYTEANGVIQNMNALQDGKYEMLNLLLAIMYRPKEKKGWFGREVIQEYDSDEVKARAKEFDALDMQTVWNCLFFFTQLKTKSLASINKSLAEEVEKVQEG